MQHDNPLQRPQSGSSLLVVIVVAITLIILPVMFLSLDFLWAAACCQRQQYAAEQAALTAARELGKVVIDDPYFGLIGLSDNPPVSKAKGNWAPDHCPIRTRSINTILATIRLDMIIARKANNEQLFEFASNDLKEAMRARECLSKNLKHSVAEEGGDAKDSNNASLSPYSLALEAYESELTRCAATRCMMLKLGSQPGCWTNTPVPEPRQHASVSSEQMLDGKYRACTDIPFEGSHFVFAAASDQARLVNPGLFQEDVKTLPYQNPSVVLVQSTSSWKLPSGKTVVLQAQAAAIPQSVTDPLPSPAVFIINCPDGVVPDYSCLGDLLGSESVRQLPMNVVSSSTGDYPDGSIVESAPGQALGTTAASADICVCRAFYDWLRSNGTKPNILSAVAMIEAQLSPNVPPDVGHVHIYQVGSNGMVSLQVLKHSPEHYSVIADRQLFAVSASSLKSERGFLFDISVNDFVYRHGRIQGGAHAGEPLPVPDLLQGEQLWKTELLSRINQGEEERKGRNGATSGMSTSRSMNMPCAWNGEGGQWGYHTFKRFSQPNNVPAPVALAKFPQQTNSYLNTKIAGEVTLRMCIAGVE